MRRWDDASLDLVGWFGERTACGFCKVFCKLLDEFLHPPSVSSAVCSQSTNGFSVIRMNESTNASLCDLFLALFLRSSVRISELSETTWRA